MQSSRFHYLLEKFKQQQLSLPEHQELLDFTTSGDDGTWDELFGALAVNQYGSKPDQDFMADELEAVLAIDKLRAAKPTIVHRVHFLKTAWFRYAAAVLVLIGAGTWLFLEQNSVKKMPVNISAAAEIKPGSNTAILILSDGSEVVLNDSAIQTITDKNISIDKRNGILVYNTVLTSENSAVSYNTMRTPRGGQYQLVLPDGSKAWLNSASSLRYPTVFKGKARVVELIGEAYFEVKQDKSMPFTVKTKRMDIAVLGTEFNINAYDDEPKIAATLVEGSVQVVYGRQVQILQPGQQANLLNDESRFNTLYPDMESVLAWKNGIFQFDDADIRFIMRQVARWYDVNIHYDKEVPKFQFSGSLLRTESPLSLLKALEKTAGVYFTIQGKEIIVHKK